MRIQVLRYQRQAGAAAWHEQQARGAIIVHRGIGAATSRHSARLPHHSTCKQVTANSQKDAASCNRASAFVPFNEARASGKPATTGVARSESRHTSASGHKPGTHEDVWLQAKGVIDAGASIVLHQVSEGDDTSIELCSILQELQPEGEWSLTIPAMETAAGLAVLWRSDEISEQPEVGFIISNEGYCFTRPLLRVAVHTCPPNSRQLIFLDVQMAADMKWEQVTEEWAALLRETSHQARVHRCVVRITGDAVYGSFDKRSVITKPCTTEASAVNKHLDNQQSICLWRTSLGSNQQGLAHTFAQGIGESRPFPPTTSYAPQLEVMDGGEGGQYMEGNAAGKEGTEEEDDNGEGNAAGEMESEEEEEYGEGDAAGEGESEEEEEYGEGDAAGEGESEEKEEEYEEGGAAKEAKREDYAAGEEESEEEQQYDLNEGFQGEAKEQETPSFMGSMGQNVRQKAVFQSGSASEAIRLQLIEEQESMLQWCKAVLPASARFVLVLLELCKESFSHLQWKEVRSGLQPGEFQEFMSLIGELEVVAREIPGLRNILQEWETQHMHLQKEDLLQYLDKIEQINEACGSTAQCVIEVLCFKARFAEQPGSGQQMKMRQLALQHNTSGLMMRLLESILAYQTEQLLSLASLGLKPHQVRMIASELQQLDTTIACYTELCHSQVGLRSWHLSARPQNIEDLERQRMRLIGQYAAHTDAYLEMLQWAKDGGVRLTAGTNLMASYSMQLSPPMSAKLQRLVSTASGTN